MANSSRIRRARYLRRSASETQTKLWVRLRQRPGGFIYRREHPIGPYFCDFYCAKARLVIELDGGHHATRSARDQARDDYFSSLNLQTLRVTTLGFLADEDRIVQWIVEECLRRSEP